MTSRWHWGKYWSIPIATITPKVIEMFFFDGTLATDGANRSTPSSVDKHDMKVQPFFFRDS